MKKLVVLGLLLGLFLVSGIQAGTLVKLPCEIGVLPDFPNASLSELYYPRTQNFDTAITTELIRWKFLFGMAGWTTNLQKWVGGAGIDIKELVGELNRTSLRTESFADALPLDIRFYVTYGFDSDLSKRCWMAGVGLNLLEVRNK